MPVTIGGGLPFCGRELTSSEWDLIGEVTRDFSSLGLTELARTICELLEWRRPNGGLKGRECYLFLLTLRSRGWLPWLPPPRPQARHPHTTTVDWQSDAQAPCTNPLQSWLPLQLQLIDTGGDRKLFEQYIHRLSLSGLPCSLRSAIALFHPQPATTRHAAGLPAIHQRCLENGAARPVHRME